jgi:hypothetical protein
METIINKFGEKQTNWKSHKHPLNDNFMQVVSYMHIEKSNGKNILYWSLCNASLNDHHFIANISLEESISKFTDDNQASIEITEGEFEKWLKEKYK